MARLTALLIVLLLVAPAFAQRAGFPVTGGEHEGFTRLVIHAPPGTSWRFEGAEALYRLTMPGAVFDLGRVYDRIRRDRIAAVTADREVLTLSLACRCLPRAWEERPGLIVIDVAESEPEAEPESGAAAPPSPGFAPPSPATVAEAARQAGIVLAREHDGARARPPSEPVPPQPPDPALLARELGLPIARALSQGLLDPPDGLDSGGGLLLDEDPAPTALPENMRIATVLDRPDPDAPPVPARSDTCLGTETLAFFVDAGDMPFATTFAALSRGLYGEFDQPDPDARRALIDLYLLSGFGAEARALIENSPDPVAGRDLLLGIADVFEDRSSNSRMRLSQVLDCGGPAAVFALLAGGQATPVPGAEIALTFTQLPQSLRAVIGAELVQALSETGATDAARIVADILRRSPWMAAALLPMIEAELDLARGDIGTASERLQRAAPSDSALVHARLDLALRTDQPISAGDIDSAAALASAERNVESGPALMESVIRLQARDNAFAGAFAGLDRLTAWLPATPSSQQSVAALTDEVWNALASHGQDLALVEAILGRDDWRSPSLSEATRLLLAGRLANLGLTAPVSVLLPTPDSANARIVRARVALELGQTRDALSWLDGLDNETARSLRAAALSQAGENAAAASELQASGDHDGAARAAILAGDWQRVQQIAPVEETAELSGFLAARPGHGPTQGGRASNAGAAAGLRSQLPEAGDPAPAAARDLAAPSAAATEPDARQNLATDGAMPPAAAPAAIDGQRTAPVAAPQPSAVSSTEPPRPRDEGAETVPNFDRLGVVTRSTRLLDESEHLRDTLRRLIEAPVN